MNEAYLTSSVYAITMIIMEKIAKAKKQQYPQYYDVDGLPVILELDGEDVVGKSASGKPYPIGKAIVDGIEITKKEYDALLAKLMT